MAPEDLELYCFDVAALNSKGKKVTDKNLKKKDVKTEKSITFFEDFFENHFSKFKINVWHHTLRFLIPMLNFGDFFVV
jgi:hypothetical protein